MSCGNPLFLKWVKEFHSEKDYKKRGGPPRATGYEKAIWALQGCSESYEHPKELLKLDGIGPTCVKRLTEKLEAYCDQRGIPMPEYKPPPRKKAAPRKKKAEPLPPGTRRNLVKIVEADVEDYPRPATFSASTSQARNPPRKSVTKRHYSDDDDEEEEGDSDDWEREDLLPENEVWAAPSGRPNAVRRTKQVARRPLPQKRTQAAPAKANEEVIELSDDSENERMPLSDESSEVDVKSKTQQKRKATEVDEEEEEEEVVEEEEEYAPVQSRKKIPHHELARMAAARRRGEPVKRRKI